MKTRDKEGSQWLDKLDHAVADNSKLSLILLFQFAVIFLLIIGYMKMVDKIKVVIELPKTIKETGTIEVGKDLASAKYFKMFGREDIETFSSFNPTSINEKMNYLKTRMYPPIYYKYSTLLKQYKANIAKNLITQKFIFDKKDIIFKGEEFASQGTVTVQGYYTKWLDDDKIIDGKSCTYSLGYKITGGHIYVETFKTDCK